MFKKPQNLMGLTVNLVLGHFKQCFCVQNCAYFVELILVDSSYILWNKFQDYQLRFILTTIFWSQLNLSFVGWLESCFLTARQHGFYNSHVNRRFSNTVECTVIVVQ